jgi:hypothetical protein
MDVYPPQVKGYYITPLSVIENLLLHM